MDYKLNTSNWKPRKSPKDNLRGAFQLRCKQIEKLILKRVEFEKELNIDNYDSGSGVEDIIREELTNLLPKRYLVSKGVINDRDGFTAGDVDIIIFNEQWFPTVKTGATKDSRRFHFPIEGVYAVGEVKQTMNSNSLKEAMKKMVVCHRLNRPHTAIDRLVENREMSGCTHGITNPLYSFIIATSLEKGTSVESLVDEFFEINKTLKRFEVVRCLCVLEEGTIVWSFYDEQAKDFKPALFMKSDTYLPILPTLSRENAKESSLYFLMLNLMLHLYHSVLGAEDIVAAYGGDANNKIRLPGNLEKFSLEPDEDWVKLLSKICEKEHNFFWL